MQKQTPRSIQPQTGDWFIIEKTPTALIPPYQLLRIWVQFINGNYGELHAAFIPEYGWDLPIGLRINIVQVLAWQKIIPPPLQNQKIIYDQSKNPLRNMMSKDNHPITAAALRRIIPIKELTITFNLSEQYIVDLYLETGTLLQNPHQTIQFDVPPPESLTRKDREVLAWLAPIYANQPIHLGYVQEMPNEKNIYTYLEKIAQIIKDQKTNELQQIYNWLHHAIQNKNNQNSHLFDQLFKVNCIKEMTTIYSHPIVNEYINILESELQKDYQHHREYWIQEYGSERLRYYLKDGNFHLEEFFVKERLQHEMPGFRPILADEVWQKKEFPEEIDVEIAAQFPNSIIVSKKIETATETVTETAILVLGFLGQYPVVGLVQHLQQKLPHQKELYHFNSLPKTTDIFKLEPVEIPPMETTPNTHVTPQKIQPEEPPSQPVVSENTFVQTPTKQTDGLDRLEQLIELTETPQTTKHIDKEPEQIKAITDPEIAQPKQNFQNPFFRYLNQNNRGGKPDFDSV